MLQKKITQTILISLLLSITFISCESGKDDGVLPSPEDNEVPSSPIPNAIGEYYFKGKIDGKELNITKNIYDQSYSEPKAYSIDYGGSQTNDIVTFGKPGTGFCRSNYSFGLIYYNFQKERKNTDTAKMHFYRVPVGDCNIEDELKSIEKNLDLKNYKYRRFNKFKLDNNSNTVGLELYPQDQNGEPKGYYSSRFGDNSNSNFTITSVKKEGDLFILEGDFSCVLYKLNDETDFKNLEDGKFRIHIKANLDK